MARREKIVTVRGSISPTEAGITLIHEHLIIDLTCWWVESSDPVERALANSPVGIEMLGRLRRDPLGVTKDNMRLSDVKTMAEELGEFRRLGGRTVVEMSNVGLGRNPIALREISSLTGVNIVAGCGYYVEPSHPASVARMGVDNLAAEMVRDITVGIGDSSVKAGIIGEIGLSGPEMTKQEAKVLKAVASAHQETGAPVSIHQSPIPSSLEGVVALDMLKDEGVNLRRVTMSHSDEKTLDVQREFLKRGAFINYDHFGLECYWDREGLRFISDGEKVDKLIELVKQGFVSQIMLSQDVCLKFQLRRYGGMGYDHLLKTIRSVLQREGVGDQEFRTMVEANPRRFLPF